MFAAGGVRPGIPRLRARLRGGWRSSTRRRRWRRLGALPGNRLKMLRGARKGQYSIWINRQWRICFTWSGELGPADVEIVDYR